MISISCIPHFLQRVVYDPLVNLGSRWFACFCSWCHFPLSVLTTTLAVRFVLGLSSHHPSALCAHHTSSWRWSVVSITGKSGWTPLQHAFEMLSFTGVVNSEAVYHAGKNDYLLHSEE